MTVEVEIKYNDKGRKEFFGTAHVSEEQLKKHGINNADGPIKNSPHEAIESIVRTFDSDPTITIEDNRTVYVADVRRIKKLTMLQVLKKARKIISNSNDVHMYVR